MTHKLRKCFRPEDDNDPLRITPNPSCTKRGGAAPMQSQPDVIHRCTMLKHPVHSLTPLTLYGHAYRNFPINLQEIYGFVFNPVNYGNFTGCIPI